MTAVGKILVFINLIFSVIVGALVTANYVTRTRWADEFSKLNGRYQIAVASGNLYKDAVTEARKEADDRVKELDARLTSARKDAEMKQVSIDKLAKDLQDEQAKRYTRDSTFDKNTREIERRQDDAKQLREALKDQTNQNIELVAKVNAMRLDKEKAVIDLRVMTDRAGQLENQLREKEKELVRVRTSGGGAARPVGGKNPPLESVEGLVKNTDPGSGLVTITIGSDAGLVKGHTLEVFRLSPVARQSKYLGTIRILEVTPTQAVGQPTGRMAAPPQAGDRVASHILGS